MAGFLIAVVGIPVAIFAVAMLPGRWLWWGVLAAAWFGYAIWVWVTRFAGPPPAGAGLGYAIEQAVLVVFGWVGAVGLAGRAALIAQGRRPFGAGRGVLVLAAVFALAPPLVLVAGYWQ